MGNSVSQTTKSTLQCAACQKSTHELKQLQLYAQEFNYIRTLIKRDALRGWSKKQIGAFILLVWFGSYCLGKMSSDLEKEKRTVGQYLMQVDTLKNELKAWSFGNAS